MGRSLAAGGRRPSKKYVTYLIVIAGLDPAISLRLETDARVKPGHDEIRSF